MNKKVLLVDDDETMRMILEEMISSRGYDTVIASNGKEGLERFEEDDFSVVITDLNMPVIDGREMIKAIKEKDDEVIFIVVSVHKEADLIIEVMKLGVYDYLIKPFSANVLAVKIERAFEAAELRRMKKTVAKEKINKLENQIAWAEYTDKLLKKDLNRIDKTLFENLHTNFATGAGLGTVLTLHKVIASTAEKDGDKYIIDSDLFDILNENATLAENAINIFSKINRIINEPVEIKKMTVTNLQNLIFNKVEELSKFAKIKNQKIVLNDPKENFSTIEVGIIEDYFNDAIEEILFNAMKFSTEHSTIIVIIEAKYDNVEINIINDPVINENGIKGIPIEYENMVLEPFYRMTKKIFIEYDSVESGLGLSLVERIIEKHNGKVKVTNLKDHSDLKKEPVVKVLVAIDLPI